MADLVRFLLANQSSLFAEMGIYNTSYIYIYIHFSTSMIKKTLIPSVICEGGGGLLQSKVRQHHPSCDTTTACATLTRERTRAHTTEVLFQWKKLVKR